jgi:hypothetical protein
VSLIGQDSTVEGMIKESVKDHMDKIQQEDITEEKFSAVPSRCSENPQILVHGGEDS